jgi:hypothetical protein
MRKTVTHVSERVLPMSPVYTHAQKKDTKEKGTLCIVLWIPSTDTLNRDGLRLRSFIRFSG